MTRWECGNGYEALSGTPKKHNDHGTTNGYLGLDS